MKAQDLKVEQLEHAANMLKAIAHPIRIAILSCLEDGKMHSVTEIHEHLKIEQAAASHHLGILKDKGILLSKRDGRNTFYYLKHESLSQILNCMQKCAIG